MKRTFLAIKISDFTKNLITAIYEDLPELDKKLKRANIDNPHITIKFLGDIKEDNIQPIGDDLKQELENFSKFGFEIASTGVFPKPSRPTVFWLGVGKGAKKLEQLHKKVEKVTNNYNISQDKRSFTPHLTIGRKRKGARITDIDQFLDYDFKPVYNQVDELIFFESILKSSGAIHKPLTKIKLEG
ncbi:MAG: RNA 2',3'-cyclic phosphodiesterase [Candidatus Marinimicrobia bacterium]|nr:RNA 2',3'-cyclic phosphodiesterase [Candidatus Neomarinimicrobiota bacterium]